MVSHCHSVGFRFCSMVALKANICLHPLLLILKHSAALSFPCALICTLILLCSTMTNVKGAALQNRSLNGCNWKKRQQKVFLTQTHSAICSTARTIDLRLYYSEGLEWKSLWEGGSTCGHSCHWVNAVWKLQVGIVFILYKNGGWVTAQNGVFACQLSVSCTKNPLQAIE